ncbi:MAG TPA: glutaredoxin domain-containing protein [Conexibacter sp.]|jgi:glutaredoxin 3|nr:glutaredoxin domain-containing protein [Conexibacter sp.]
MAKITLYTTDACSSCRRAKAFLDQRGLPFDEINLSRDPDGRVELAERTGLMTFPQILVGDVTLGGFEALAAAEADGRLRELLAGPIASG